MGTRIKDNIPIFIIIFLGNIVLLSCLAAKKTSLALLILTSLSAVFILLRLLKIIKRSMLEYLNGPKRFCKGRGIEIGSGRNPMIKGSILVDIVTDFSDKEPYRVDYVADAHELPKIESASLDYVCTSHVLEHLTNPIKAILEWIRILKLGGVIWLKIPDKRKTFDRKRERTTLSHLIEDYEKNISFDDPTHIYDHNATTDSPRNEKHPYIHNHVWIPEDIVELFNYIDKRYTRLRIMRCSENTCKNAQDFWVAVENKVVK